MLRTLSRMFSRLPLDRLSGNTNAPMRETGVQSAGIVRKIIPLRSKPVAYHHISLVRRQCRVEIEDNADSGQSGRIQHARVFLDGLYQSRVAYGAVDGYSMRFFLQEYGIGTRF